MWPTVKFSQRGDTLIEVIIATVIVGVVLLSAFTLGNKAFQLGQSARERSQATQLLQAQAEGLTALRNSQTWAAFRTNLTTQAGGNLNPFHLERLSGQWVVRPGGNWDPSTDPGINVGELPDFYDVTVTGCFVDDAGVCALPTASDRVNLTINITWPRFGGGVTETSTLYMRLANRTLQNL